MESYFFFCLLIPLVLAIGIAIRLATGSWDRERIRQYVEQRGGKFIEAVWSPFGPGWFGGSKERIYQVCYRDREGNIHQAFARTSMWTGVYFTEDNFVHRANDEVVETLEEENARLRAELDRLKRKERDRNSDAIEE